MIAYKQIKKKQGNKHSESESSILNWTCTGHKGSRWYTSDPPVVVIDIYVFVPLWHQSLFPDMEYTFI